MRFKELAKKAADGHKKATSVFLMILPKGMMPEGSDAGEYAKEVSGDESVEDYEIEEDSFFEYMGVSEEEVENDDPNVDEQGTGFPDLKLKKAIFDSLKPLDLPEEAVKAVCSAVYDGILGGDIFPRLEKGQEEAHNSNSDEEESDY